MIHKALVETGNHIASVLPADEILFLGSLTRAAILNGPLPDMDRHRFNDIDIADGSRRLTDLYRIPSGGKVDFRPSQHIALVRPGVWGLFDLDGSQLGEVNADHLGISKVTSKALGFESIPTIDACSHVALQTYYHALYRQRVMPKHQEQFMRLKQQLGSLCAGCNSDSVLAAVREAAHNVNYTNRSRYTRTRSYIFDTFPHMATRFSEGKPGKAYRRIRGSESSIELLPDTLLPKQAK